MQVQILTTSVSTKPTKTGKSYQNVEVAFKNLETGKVESKNVTSYSTVFKSVSEATSGQVYDIEQEKNSGGFWEWTSFKRGAGPTPAAPSVIEAVKQVKSQYETPEERAKKQAYIVKQSSLAQAVALLSVGAKTQPKTQDVLKLAQELTDWVFDDAVKFDDVPDFPLNIEVD